MKNTELYGTSNTELVTISRAEYERNWSPFPVRNMRNYWVRGNSF